MTVSAPEWNADTYRVDNAGQFETALEALMQAGAHLHTGGRFADVGCGSGELAAAMAQRGFEVVANDHSASMVAAARQLCADLPVEVEVQDAHALKLPEDGFDVVHSAWMLHWLSDAAPAVRTMARATRPGGLVVLQWSCGQPRAEGFALREVIHSVVASPAWRDRLADAPVAMHHHPAEELAAVLAEEGLEVLVTEHHIRVPGGEDPAALRRALRAASFNTQAEVLGDDTDAFIDDVIRALLEARALDPRNVRVIARRPLAVHRAAGRSGPRSAIRRFPLAVGRLEVAATERLTPLMRRLTLRQLGGDPLPLREPAETITALWPAEGADDVVLPEVGRWRFPAGTGLQHTANLTVRRYDEATGLLTVDVFVHGGGGRCAEWARDARPGDRIGFGGSRVHWVADAYAAWTLLIGDETALPSIAAIAETLPAGMPATAVIEVRDEAEHAALDTDRLDVRWVHRGERAPGDGAALLAAVAAVDLPAGRGQVFAGGESRVIDALRRHLRTERGLDRDQVSVQGYWNRPKPG